MATISDSQKNVLNQSLLRAVAEQNETEVLSLLDQGADPDTRNETGDTLLNIALSNETISPKIIELLVEGGAHVNYVSSDRVTPLMCAVYNVNVPFETVAYLLQAGASVYSRDTYGQTPLLYATGREDVALVDLLLSYGASVNETDADGNALTVEAVKQGYENLFTYLVDQGVDLTIRDYQGTTLLMMALEQKQLNMAKLLLDFPEVDVLGERVDGLTALDLVQDMLSDGELLDEEETKTAQLLKEMISARASERLAFSSDLDDYSYNPLSFAEEEENEANFVDLDESINDGFDDLYVQEEALETDEELSLSEDEEIYDEEWADVEGVDEDTPTFVEIKEQAPISQEEDVLNNEEAFVLSEGTQADEGIYDEDLSLSKDEEYDEEWDDVEGVDEDTPTFVEIKEQAPISQEEDVLNNEEAFVLSEGTQADEGIYDEDLSFVENEDVYEEELAFVSNAENDEESLSSYDEEPLTYGEEEDAFEEELPVWTEPLVEDEASFIEAEESQNMGVFNLPLYSVEACAHADKMIKKYTEYQSEDGQKGVYISGVYLTNRACSQARVHIERNLIQLGYSSEQAHDQSSVLLYKLIRANGLYHPKEFILTDDGQKMLAFKVWGCDHRKLLKSLTEEFEPEGDWYQSLHELEKYVGEKGEGKLSLAS